MPQLLKRRIKSALATLAETFGVIARAERGHRSAWTIVCYHRILPPEARARHFCPDLVVTPASLDAHCAVFREFYEVVTVSEGLTRLASGLGGDKPLLSLSFDDGYQDNFVHAAPILAQHGLHASFYIIAGLVWTDEIPWYDQVARASTDAAAARAEVELLKTVPWNSLQTRLAELSPTPEELEKLDPLDLIMTPEQLKVLGEMGHEIGAHSMSHPVLTRIAPNQLHSEISTARKYLADLLGKPIETFCYPNGDYDDAVLAETRKAGYRGALSTRQGVNQPGMDVYALARVFMHEERLCAPRGRASRALLRMELALKGPVSSASARTV